MNFHPLFLSPLLSFFFSYPSNIEIILHFSDIITKISPPFQNPGSALAYPHQAWRLILTDKLVTTEDEFGARDNQGKETNTK